jgi:conjugal transfer pilus assembly protein TraF
MEERLYRGIRLLKGETTPENWSLYEFQKGQGFDVKAPQSGDKSGGNQ